jgi:hypothetical protein
LENTLPPGGREKISADVFWGKNMKKRRKEKGGKCTGTRQQGEKNEERGKKIRKLVK